MKGKRKKEVTSTSLAEEGKWFCFTTDWSHSISWGERNGRPEKSLDIIIIVYILTSPTNY